MKTILLVDDEKASRELFKMTVYWEQTDYKIAGEARNGVQALEMLLAQPYDLVITDVQMPVMDGIELIRRIREIMPEQKIAVLSCHERFEYAKQAFKLGIVDYLIKDYITHTEVKEVLERLELPDNPTNAESRYTPRIRNIITYIEQHIAEDISLLQLEKTFNVHRVHLTRQFKLETGCTPGNYIRNLRIEKAKQLLLEGVYPISEIIAQIGFRNPQNFYTAFKKLTGVTPNEFCGKRH